MKSCGREPLTCRQALSIKASTSRMTSWLQGLPETLQCPIAAIIRVTLARTVVQTKDNRSGPSCWAESVCDPPTLAIQASRRSLEFQPLWLRRRETKILTSSLSCMRRRGLKHKQVSRTAMKQVAVASADANLVLPMTLKIWTIRCTWFRLLPPFTCKTSDSTQLIGFL